MLLTSGEVVGGLSKLLISVLCGPTLKSNAASQGHILN